MVADTPPLLGLSICTLGGFNVTRHYASGEQFEVPAAAWRHGRTLALAQYLLAKPGFGGSRDAIREALWPSDDPLVARAYLSNALWNLRRVLGVPKEDRRFLLVTATAIRLNVERATSHMVGTGIWLDTLAFKAAVQHLMGAQDRDPQERLMLSEKALALYQGDFLPRCKEPHWIRSTRERLRELWATAQALLARAYVDLGASDEALNALQRVLTTMPDHEVSAMLALQLMMGQNRQREARALYESIRSFYRDWYRQEPPRALKQIVGPALSSSARTTIPLPRKR